MTPRLSDYPVSITPAVGLAPWRHVLANGIVVVGKETRKTPAVTINLSMRAGSIADPPGRPGATYLLSKLLDQGTATRSAVEIAEGFEDRGATIAVAVTRHVLSLTCTCLASDFDAVLALLAEIVMAPSMPESELRVQKGEVLTQLQQDADSPAIRAVEQLMSSLYGSEHPYGRPSRGTADVVDALTRAQLLELHRTRFAPALLTMVIVGDVQEAVATRAVESAFGSWQAAKPDEIVLPGVAHATTRRTAVIPMMAKAQVDIAYGFTTIARADPRYYAFWLLNVALGQYAMGGRLGESIRERQGMAYYASSSFDANVLPGPFVVRAGVSAANVERTIRSIDEELQAVRRHGLTTQEFVEARQYMIGSLPRMLESNAGIAHFLQTAEFFALGPDYDTRIPGLLARVTLDDVQALADEFLAPHAATIVVAGPFDGALPSA